MKNNSNLKYGKLFIFSLLFVIYSCSKDDIYVRLKKSGKNIRTICTNGSAGGFPCEDYDLMAHIDLSVLSARSANDSWGWTDTLDDKEYAIIGLNNGTAFVDITNASVPIYIGKLPTATVDSGWRDIKVYKNHAFIVSEARGHGMHVFDLTKLRDTSNLPKIFTADSHFTDFGNAHNIVINESSGYAYIVGASGNRMYRGGPLFINIKDPKNPKSEGGWGMDGYSHDAQVVMYSGPDTDYFCKEIFIGSNSNEVVIVDVTDKTNPKSISRISYEDVEYVHQGWLTEDQKYFIVGDELDEGRHGFKTRSIVFDFSDLDAPKQKFIYNGTTNSTDHNGYIKGNIFYLASYTAGVRFIDISSIDSGTMQEVGYFDTYPSNNEAGFNGVWNVYPYFKSGNIVISDRSKGLFIVRKTGS